MKKLFGICIVFAAIVSLTSCDSGGGSKSLLGTTTAGGQVVSTPTSFTLIQLTNCAEQLYTGALNGFNSASYTTATTDTINYTYAGSSGNMYVSGTITKTISGSIYIWTFTSVSESLNSFSFQNNSDIFVISGSMTITGTMRLLNNSTPVQSPSNIAINGTCSITSNGFTQNVPISVSVTPNSNEVNGTMTGTINGLTVNQSF